MTELETMQRAKMYLDKLARGIDPITDREMPEDAVLNNVRICRCLHYVSRFPLLSCQIMILFSVIIFSGCLSKTSKGTFSNI